MTTLATVAAGTGAITDINDNFIATSPAAMYGRRASATSGLTWGYYGGIAFGATIANGTVSLTASSTNYIVASRSTGAVSVATSTTNWNNATDYFRLYQVVAGSASVSSYTDHRDFTGGGSGGGGATDFTDLGDVPASYTGEGGAYVRVKATEDGLEFVPGGSGGDAEDITYDPSTSGLTATNVQAAIDEIAGGGGGMSNPMTTAGDIIIGGSSGAPQRLAADADGYVLTLVSGAPAWAASSGGSGLSYISEALNTANPNGTVNSVSLTVTGGSTNADLALSPKGTGALTARVPDNTTAGGNKRGNYALDLQMSRTNAAQVASGQYSVTLGANNTASANYSMVLGGQLNSATGQGSAAFGQSCSSSGNSSVACGSNTSADANYAFSSGQYSSARGVIGARAHASGRFSSAGDAQDRNFLLRNVSNSATPVVLSADGSSASSSNTIALVNSSVYAFDGLVTARSSSDWRTWKISGGISRGANAASTALGTAGATVTDLDGSAGASTWSIAVSADTSIGGLKIEATGATSTNIKWVASVLTAEVVG